MNGHSVTGIQQILICCGHVCNLGNVPGIWEKRAYPFDLCTLSYNQGSLACKRLICCTYLGWGGLCVSISLLSVFRVV
jgi:hypothetical protein